MATNNNLGVTTLTTKTSTVRFYKVYAGTRKKKDELFKLFESLVVGKTLPHNLSAFKIEADDYQLRDLNKSAGFWWGCFGRLRTDAPNVVNSSTGTETALALGKDDKLLEKSYFLYSEAENCLLWHVNNSAGGIGIFKEYLQKIAACYVRTEYVLDQVHLANLLSGDIKEIIFNVSELSPQSIQQLGWSGDAMRLVKGAGASSVKFELKAPAAGKLNTRYIKPLVNKLSSSGLQRQHLKIRAGTMTDPVDIFLNTLKDEITYNKSGHYPVPTSIIGQLKSCYIKNKGKI